MDMEKYKLGADPSNPRGEAGKEMLESMNAGHYEMTGWALDYLDIEDGCRILDIGCGGGATIGRLLEKYGRARFCGLDYSEASLEKCAEYNAEAVSSGRLELVKASVEKMPFEDGEFDRVITVESFYFWPDPAENLKEVYRIIRPGGKMLLVAEIYENGSLCEESRNNISDYSLFNPTADEFRTLFENAGFTDIGLHFLDGEEWICITASR